MKYSFFLFSCCFVFSLYPVHDRDYSLLIRALDLPEFSDYIRDSKTAKYTTQTLYTCGVQYRASNQSNKALDYFAAAARLEHRPSCYELSILMYEKGDYRQAVYWLMHAARAEQVNAQHKLLTWYMSALCFLEEIYAGVYGQDMYNALISADYQGDYYTQLFTQACAYYAEKKYAQAYELFNFLSFYRHPLALYMLGVCYDTGNGIERDKCTAYNYYKQAAEYGYIQAQQACSVRDKLYTLEEHVTQVVQQLEQYSLSDTAVSADCITTVNRMLCEFVSKGTLEDNEHFVQFIDSKNMRSTLEHYAQQGSAYAAYVCGFIYKHKDTEKSDAYLKIAAQKNIVRAGFMLGEYYRYTCPIQALDYYLRCALADTEDTQDDTQDYERQLIRTAYERIQESAAKQDSYACICRVLYGIADQKNTEKYVQALQECKKLFLQACDDATLAELIKISPLPSTLMIYAYSDARVEYLRALLYLQVPTFLNRQQGIASLRLAADKGSPEAQVMLSIYLTHGIDGIEKDLAQAFTLLVKAHEQGFALATFHLANAYKDGILVPQDLAKARALLHSSCLNDCALALCYRVADALDQACGDIKDNSEVYNLLELLEGHAQAGDVNACLTLGLAYYHARDGWGKDKLTRAFTYLEKAAAKGYIEAYRIMGRMLYFAEGITGDKAHGQALLCKAKLLGDQEVLYDLAEVFYDRQEYQQAFLYYQDSYNKIKSADAAAGLALCYVYGHGVKQDIRQAVNYISFALKNGVNPTAGFKSLHIKHVLPVVLEAVIKLANLANSNAQAAHFMLDLLTRVLQSVGFAWQEIADTIVIYPNC